MDAQILATDIVRKLVKAGYIAYFAGGWVRDYLMGHPSEDIDIATDAPPEKILDLFPQTILVGLAFGVVIVVADGHQFEVATFRRDIEYLDGRKPTQIELSSPEGDASRRDFTINGMFYDPLTNIVHDYVHGTVDLKHCIIRTIGDPYERFLEDRLRMIRAVRFAARFGFIIDPETQEAIRANAEKLFPSVAMERIWQEFTKMSKYPRFDAALIDMHRLGLLQTIFPALSGVHLNDIKKHVSEYAHYPKGAETILYLMALFPEINEEGIEELCKYLRTSVAEAVLATYLIRFKRYAKHEEQGVPVEKREWMHIYAHPAFDRCLQMIAAPMTEDKRRAFLETHRQRALINRDHIKRIVEKKPLVNAAWLQKYGIPSGKNMGLLLKEAESLVIDNDIENPEAAIELLRKTPLWTQKL